MTDFELSVSEMVKLLPEERPSMADWIVSQELYAKRWRSISCAYGPISEKIINSALFQKYGDQHDNSGSI